MTATAIPPALGGSRPPRRPRDARLRAALLVASAVLHAAILIPMALRLFETDLSVPPPPDTPIYIDIEPRPLLEGERARVPTVSTPSAAAVETRPLTGPTAILPAPARPEDEDDAPSAPVPRITTGPSGQITPGTPAASDSGAWQVRPPSMEARVARSLRLGAGGCRIMDGRLSPAEQRLCDDAFNEAAGRAGPIGPRTLSPGEARREAGFARDGARALAQYEARRAPLKGGVGVSGASPDCPGGNLRGSCAMSHLPAHMRHPEEMPYTRPQPPQ